jgi:hypothetical protein
VGGTLLGAFGGLLPFGLAYDLQKGRIAANNWGLWWPFHFIAVLGFQDGRKTRMFFIGALMTKKKESLVYIANHVDESVMEENVLQLAEKYRRQLQKKSQIDV